VARTGLRPQGVKVTSRPVNKENLMPVTRCPNRRIDRLRTAVVLLAVCAALVVGLVPAQARPGGDAGPSKAGGHPAANTYDNHCIAPWGEDFNETYGVSEAIVTGFCHDVDSGEFWAPFASPWITNTTHEFIPAGYVPSGPTPIEDFKAKFLGARYVVDAGTPQERSFSYPAAQVLRTFVGNDGFPFARWWAILSPLPPGTHTVDRYVSMAAGHWDGFAVNPAENFLPAGEIFWGGGTLRVTAGADQRKH
jgi:hypothetical protein